MFDIEKFRCTDERLEEMAVACRQFVDRSLTDGDTESIRPQVLVDARGPGDAESVLEISVLAVPFNSHVEKHAAMHGIGAGLYKRQRVPLAAFLISEAWSSKLVAGEDRKFLLPEDDPERGEIALYMGVSLDGRVLHGHIPIRRDKQNLLSAGGEWEVFSEGKLSSPLVSQVFRGFISQLPAPMSDRLLRR